MKKIFLLFIFILLVVVYLVINPKTCSNKKTKVYQINNKNYCLLTANNPEQWERGLMFYKKPINFDGMIFIFPEKQMRSFWNKNTYLNLDVYWLEDNKVVNKSYLPSILKSKEIVIVKSAKEVDKVIEIVKE